MKIKKEDIVVLSTAVIAGATLVNLIVAIFMWNVTSDSLEFTKDVFNISNRPIIGIYQDSLEVNDSDKVITIMTSIKNYGNLPANVINIDYRSIIDKDTLVEIMKDTLKVLYPTGYGSFGRIISRKYYDKLLSGDIELKNIVKVRYLGLTKDTLFMESITTYLPKRKSFLYTSGYWK